MLKNSLPWIEKYRPSKINDLVQENHITELFNNIIKTQEMPHLLFYGQPGTGKTSSIIALGKELFKNFYQDRIIEFNASDDRGINAVREKITRSAKQYVSSLESSDGTLIPPYKIIILDEADSMTDEAQDALRVVIEQYSKVSRFCFICNYVNKITDAIKSRCSIVNFKKIDNDKIINKLKLIAQNESMDLSDSEFKLISDLTYGDMRKSIMVLQNVKSRYAFNELISKRFSDLCINELLIVSKLNFSNFSNKPKIEDEIYKITGWMTPNEVNDLFNKIMNAKNIKQLNLIAQDVKNIGIALDNIILQLNEIIIKADIIDNYKKAKIINKSIEITFLLKDGASEYIQILSFMVFIFNTMK